MFCGEGYRVGVEMGKELLSLVNLSFLSRLPLLTYLE